MPYLRHIKPLFSILGSISDNSFISAPNISGKLPNDMSSLALSCKYTSSFLVVLTKIPQWRNSAVLAGFQHPSLAILSARVAVCGRSAAHSIEMAATPSARLSKPCNDRQEDVADGDFIGEKSLVRRRIVAGMYNSDVQTREKDMVATSRVGLRVWET